MEDNNTPQDSPKKTSASSVITLAVIGALVAVFVGFILFYPTPDKTADEEDTGYVPEERTVLKVGEAAPDFTLTDTEGKQWSLSALRGKVVLVNFWATWCPPCRFEMPTISHLHELNASNEQFQILTVLYRDNPEAAKSYFEKNDFTMPILLDEDSTAARAYGLTGVPETFIIDKEGVLQRKVIGPPPGGFDTEEYLAYFDELAGQ